VCAQEPSKTVPEHKPQQTDGVQQVLDNGRQLLRQGQIEDAIKEFRRAATLRDDKCAQCFEMIGQVYFQLRQLKDAVAAFRKAAELKPANEGEIYNILGVALYLQNEKESYEQAVEALQRAIEVSQGKVVKAYYNLGFSLIKAGKEQEGIAALKKYIELDPESNDVAQARAVVANTRMVDARIAPAFSVKSHTGEELALEKLRGKIVLLDFWASWCGPCRVDIPEVKEIWKRHSRDQFLIIGISLDSNRHLFDAYMKEEGISWPQYYDGLGWGNKLARLYGVYAIPQTILIDQNGAIKAMGLRGEQLSEKVAEMLKTLKK